jgi:hypothetical protein
MNFNDPRFRAIRKALNKMFPDGIPDELVKLVNALPVNITGAKIAEIASLIDRLAAKHIAATNAIIKQIKSALSLDGAIGPGGGMAHTPHPKKLK